MMGFLSVPLNVAAAQEGGEFDIKEMILHHLADSREALEFFGQLRRNRIVDRDQRNGLAASLPPAEIEGRDVDPRLAERRS